MEWKRSGEGHAERRGAGAEAATRSPGPAPDPDTPVSPCRLRLASRDDTAGRAVERGEQDRVRASDRDQDLSETDRGNDRRPPFTIRLRV